METPPLIAAVRRRPGMYVGGNDGSGILHMVLEVLANAYDQHLVGRCSTISVEIAADGTIAIQDDGPGMSVEGGNGLPPLDMLLGSLSQQPTVDGHRPHVHLGLGGMGLFVVNALSERFELVTVRAGFETRTTYARGEVVEPIVSTASQRANGTTIRFRPDRSIFPHVRVPRAALASHLEDLTFLTPRLTLKWTIAGDDAAGAGLVGRVALDVECAFEEVARYNGSYETAHGPIDVEVALAWYESQPGTGAKPKIASFVNLARTRGDGSHVDGLIDGIGTFFSTGDRTACAARLVAAVAVVLADVKYGSPTRDRLETPEARAPVADATKKALDAWAKTHPDAADARKTRLSTR